MNRQFYSFTSLTNELLRRLTCNWPKFNPVSIDYVIVRMNNVVHRLECCLKLLDTLNDRHGQLDTHFTSKAIIMKFRYCKLQVIEIKNGYYTQRTYNKN